MIQYVLSHTIHSDLAPATFAASRSGLRQDGEQPCCLPWCWQKYLADHSSQDRYVPANDFLIALIHFSEGGVISFTCWGLGVVEDHLYRNTGEMFKLQKQSSFFWMNFTIGTSGALDPLFHPLSLLSVYALRRQN